MSTKIEWTNETWNPVVGCSKISEGCENCYAEKMACRLTSMEYAEYDRSHDGEASMSDAKPVGYYDSVTDLSKRQWNGRTVLVESALEKPLHWKKPRKIFVCSMGDLFHESVPFDWVDKVMAIIVLCPQHTFQVLTKRPERMAEYFCGLRDSTEQALRLSLGGICNDPNRHHAAMTYRKGGSLPNLWLGVTAENQQRADERIPILLQIPAAKRFVSIEPMLGKINLISDIGGTLWIGGQRGCSGKHRGIGTPDCPITLHHHHDHRCKMGLDWVIVGGETGHNARPMNNEWATLIQQQCESAGVPFFYKSSGGRNKISALNGVEYKEFPK